MNSKTVATNKKARFDFFLEETFVAGLMLEGWEVKSLREGKLNIKEAYIKDIKGELFLVGSRIDPASYINQKDLTNPNRFRKLLLNKKEINKLIGRINREGFTLIPTKMYFKKGKIKIEIAVAKGKKEYDKRQTKKKRDWNREKARIFRKTS